MAADISEQTRALVVSRAKGRCEYCHIHESDAGYSHHVDHIVSRKHGGLSGEGNLAFACAICNRYKGADIASLGGSGELIRLLNPRTDTWEDHLQHAGVEICPRSEIGEVTIRILRLNLPERLEERRILQVLNRYPVE